MLTISVAAFKAENNIDSMSLVKSPKTGKLFVALSNGQNIKAQQSLDIDKPVAVLINDDNEPCLINQNTTNIIATF